MAGGWWGENREGRTWEGKGRTMEGEEGREMEGQGRTRKGTREGRGKDKGKGERISVG